MQALKKPLSVRVKPETFERVQALARQKRISQGEVIDQLLEAPQGAPNLNQPVLAYLLPLDSVQTSALPILEGK